MIRPFPEPPSTLPEALERAARAFPERGIAVFDSRGRRSERRSYPELLASVRLAAGRWAALGVEPGDRILISVPTSWSWFEAWLGALWLGAMPVGVAPGAALGAAAAQIRKIEGLVETLGARRAVVTAGFRDGAEEAGAARITEVAITPAELEGLAPARFDRPRPEPSETAFLQLTSGSTGLPRAVSIPHRAVIHNAMGSDEAIGAPWGKPAHEWA